MSLYHPTQFVSFVDSRCTGWSILSASLIQTERFLCDPLRLSTKVLCDPKIMLRCCAIFLVPDVDFFSRVLRLGQIMWIQRLVIDFFVCNLWCYTEMHRWRTNWWSGCIVVIIFGLSFRKRDLIKPISLERWLIPTKIFFSQNHNTLDNKCTSLIVILNRSRTCYGICSPGRIPKRFSESVVKNPRRKNHQLNLRQ